MLFIKSIGKNLSHLQSLKITQNFQIRNIQTAIISKNYFSTLKSDKNPDQLAQGLRKMIQQQENIKNKNKPQSISILKDISQVNTLQQLDQIYKKLIFMSDSDRQISIRYLLSGIYQGKIPFEALNDKKIDVALKGFPNLKLESQIFQINYLLAKVREIRFLQQQTDKQAKLLPLFNKINDLFYNSFNISLKQVPTQILAKSKSTLYKNFAQYNYQYIFNPNITDQRSSLFDGNINILKKAREFLVQALQCHKQILLKQYHKIDNQEMDKLKHQDNQRHLIKINAIKQNIRKIVQSIGQCLYAFFKIINKQHRLLKDPNEYKNRKLQLLSLIETYLPMYSIVPGIKQISLSYFKLFKIKIQAKFTALNQPKSVQQSKQKIKQTIQQYSRLYRQCQDSLDQVIKQDRFLNVKEIATTMITTKYMVGKTVRKNQQQIKNSIAIGAKDIIDKMKPQWKKPMQTYIVKIMKEILQLKN